MSQSTFQKSVDVKKYETCYPFYMLLNPSFKMTTGFANVVRTTASTSKFVY